METLFFCMTVIAVIMVLDFIVALIFGRCT